jgi:hypothetical protein
MSSRISYDTIYERNFESIQGTRRSNKWIKKYLGDDDIQRTGRRIRLCGDWRCDSTKGARNHMAPPSNHQGVGDETLPLLFFWGGE